jgi:drug/metabolite transporter (DMT)-like permease
MTPPPAHPASTRPIRRGVVLAALAAMLFGMTAPLLKKASAGVGPLLAGALLYLGAAAGAGLMALGRRQRQRRRGARAGSAADEASATADGAAGARPAAITSQMLGRFVLVAIVGAAVAPALLVAGLARTDGATASLLLALEAPFTLAIAWIFLREFIGGRVLAAALLILGGGAALVAGSFGSTIAISGTALVAGAALAWAFDNLFSRPLADRDPLTVVACKGLLGALASGVAGALAGERPPPVAKALPLLLIGAIGYGISLQLYLRAQRLVGAARTASVFSVAPFAGVVVAFIAGAPWPGAQLPVAAVLVGLGLWLHLTERHEHFHHHDALEHDHLHEHTDGHHGHHHEPMPTGAHSHRHLHDAVTHGHDHSEDLHHRHRH